MSWLVFGVVSLHAFGAVPFNDNQCASKKHRIPDQLFVSDVSGCIWLCLFVDCAGTCLVFVAASCLNAGTDSVNAGTDLMNTVIKYIQ